MDFNLKSKGIFGVIRNIKQEEPKIIEKKIFVSRKTYNSLYHQKNKDKINERKKLYYINNKEKILKNSNDYYLNKKLNKK